MQWPRRLYQGDMSEGLRAFNCLHLPSDAMGLGMAQALTVRRDPSLPACARAAQSAARPVGVVSRAFAHLALDHAHSCALRAQI